MVAGLPPDVLAGIEKWLQAGMASSMAELGDGWREQYFVAPIWRLFLGADVLGLSVVGAAMPSVDAVGRCFPLLLLHVGEPGTDLVPPFVLGRETWFADVEERLLSVLEPDFDGAPSVLLEGLAEPGGSVPAGPVLVRDGFDASALVRNAAPLASASISSGIHCLWTEGSSLVPPTFSCGLGMPDPKCFADLLRDGSRPVLPEQEAAA